MKFYRHILQRFAPIAFRSFAALVLALLCAGSARAQAPKSRINARIDDAARVVLRGTVPLPARPEFDQGEAPAQTEMKHVRLFLQRTPEQQASLDKYLAGLIDKSSPNYHKWLTPDEFGRLFGAADGDIAVIEKWLESEGLTVVAVPRGRTSIEFSGSVGLMEQVFRTSIHTFKNGDNEFLANVTDPSIPAALADLVTGIVDLNTIQPESDLVRGPSGRFDPDAKRLVPTAGERAQPQYTGTRNSEPFLFIVPADVATMYNTPNKTLNANFAGGTSYDGTGVTIGIIGEAPFASSDTAIVKNWRKLFLPSTYPLDLTVTNVGGATSSNALDEAFLDLETAGGVAPGSALHFYTSPVSILPAITQALEDNTVDILNVSFGKCEQIAGNTFNQTILGDWQQAAAQGITVTVSAGDTGSARCDQNGSPEAAAGLAVNAYASTPYNIAVGGTDTYGLVKDFSEYVDPASSDSSKGFYRTVLNPIPESTWNNSQDSPDAVPGPIAKAVVYTDTTDAGGGGASSCSTQSTAGKCTAGYAKPSWQAGKGVPADRVRDVPDLALMSGPGADSAAWLVCSPDLGDCAAESSGGFGFTGIGGTSAAAPAFAGMLALVEQKTRGRLGQEAGKNLYGLYNNFGSRVFNDITLGNNAPPCYAPSPGIPSPNCVKNAAGYYFESGYNSGIGYDQASGLGSVNATNLVEFWGAAAPLPATVTVKPALETVFRGDSLSVTVTVSGKSGTPTGTATLTAGAFTSAAKPLAAGKATITIPASTLKAGANTLVVSYSGDPKFGEATGHATVTVTLLTPTVTVTPASTTASRAKSLLVIVKVAASAGTPAGAVTLSSGTYKSAAAALAGGKAKITIPADKLAVGKDTLTAEFKGNGNYKSASGDAKVTVTK
jgi:subtilase family serine protease